MESVKQEVKEVEEGENPKQPYLLTIQTLNLYYII